MNRRAFLRSSVALAAAAAVPAIAFGRDVDAEFVAALDSKFLAIYERNARELLKAREDMFLYGQYAYFAHHDGTVTHLPLRDLRPDLFRHEPSV